MGLDEGNTGVFGGNHRADNQDSLLFLRRECGKTGNQWFRADVVACDLADNLGETPRIGHRLVSESGDFECNGDLTPTIERLPLTGYNLIP
jgi:hypothetical protein